MEDLAQAIQELHGCVATYRESIKVTETFEGRRVWEGTVDVFDVKHPSTDTCYTWSSPIEGSDKKKFYAVLKISPVDSPRAAVRASIVADYKGGVV